MHATESGATKSTNAYVRHFHNPISVKIYRGIVIYVVTKLMGYDKDFQ